MIETTIVALSDDDVMFSGARPGTSGQGSTKKSKGKGTAKKRPLSAKAKKERARERYRANLPSAAAKAKDTRDFKNKTGRYKKKSIKKKVPSRP